MSTSTLRPVVVVMLAILLAIAPLHLLPKPGMPFVHAQTPPTATEGGGQANPTDCGISNYFTDFSWCVIRPSLNALGSIALAFGAGVLTLVGAMFDYFLNALVINFKDTLDGLQILPGIEQGWQLFRDLANIVIIGVFVFVAIMTILGSTEYGTKRLVSRVLIVAILINFSLLFTRVIIESTNFVAGQFARAMPAYTNETGPNTASSFLAAFGIKDVFNTYNVVDMAAQKSQSATIGFFYGVVAGIALLGISGVLLYGIFIISARALLLIFMMLTSALAFASFLIPKWSTQAYIGWSSWWSNLLKAAMFGPLLMIFLWVAMKVIQQAATVAKAGNGVNQVAANPATASPSAWSGVILLVIGTGLLFIAIRASSSFASSIGGFNWATVASILPATLGSRFVAAPLGRKFIGMPALERQLALEDDIKQAKAAGNWSRAAILQKDYAQAVKIASRDFNAMNTNIAKLATKSLGVPTMLSGERKLGGAAGIATKAAKETAKELKNLQPSAQELASAGKAAADQVREGNKELAESLKSDRDAAVARREAMGGSGSGTRTEQKQITDTIRKAVEDGSSSGANAAQRQIEHKREVDAERKAEIGQVTNKIAEVKTGINREIAQEINDAHAALGPLSMLDADVTNATNRMTMNQFDTEQRATEAGLRAQAGAVDMLQSAIQESLERRGNNNPATQKITMNMMRENNENKNMARLMDMIKEQDHS